MSTTPSFCECLGCERCTDTGKNPGCRVKEYLETTLDENDDMQLLCPDCLVQERYELCQGCGMWLSTEESVEKPCEAFHQD